MSEERLEITVEEYKALDGDFICRIMAGGSSGALAIGCGADKEDARRDGMSDLEELYEAMGRFILEKANEDRRSAQAGGAGGGDVSGGADVGV